MSLMNLFNWGMARDFNDAKPVFANVAYPGLNLGGGKKEVPNFYNLQLPEWDAETDDIPFPEEHFNQVVAFHFLEHLTGKGIARVFFEVERVLRPGGTFTVCVPHRLGGMAFQDPDHKTFFTEDTWRILLNNDYYFRPWDNPCSLEVTLNLIVGETERTLALLTQFRKPKETP